MKALISSVGLAVGAFFIPGQAIEPLARVVVPAIALTATGIFPCMTLAVNAMKAEQRTPALIDDLYDQLKTLMKVLIATFALAVLAIAFMAIAVATISFPALSNLTHGSLAAFAFSVGLLGGRIVALGRAFFVLLDINRKQALLAARSKSKSERDTAMEKSRASRFRPDDTNPKLLSKH